MKIEVDFPTNGLPYDLELVGATKVDKTEFQPDGVSTRDYVYTWKSAINGTPFGVAELA